MKRLAVLVYSLNRDPDGIGELGTCVNCRLLLLSGLVGIFSTNQLIGALSLLLTVTWTLSTEATKRATTPMDVE